MLFPMWLTNGGNISDVARSSITTHIGNGCNRCCKIDSMLIKVASNTSEMQIAPYILTFMHKHSCNHEHAHRLTQTHTHTHSAARLVKPRMSENCKA